MSGTGAAQSAAETHDASPATKIDAVRARFAAMGAIVVVSSTTAFDKFLLAGID